MIVGCPVYNRGWILDKWFAAVERIIAPDRYVFVYTPSDDDTREIILKWAKRTPVTLINYEEGTHGEDRDWANEYRIRTLADMRNILLDEVARYKHDFISLDSDVILKSRGFIYHTSEWDAFAPTVSLASDRTIINAFHERRPDGWVRRAKPGEHSVVSVICAAKYMQHHVVADKDVRYDYHPRGEDFAWSERALANGHVLGLCTEPAEHYMTKGRPPILPPTADAYAYSRDPLHGILSDA